MPHSAFSSAISARRVRPDGRRLGEIPGEAKPGLDLAAAPSASLEEACSEGRHDPTPGFARRLESIQYIEQCLDLGLISEAWQALEAAARTDWQDPSLLAVRARVYQAAGMPEAAAAVIRGLGRLLNE